LQIIKGKQSLGSELIDRELKRYGEEDLMSVSEGQEQELQAQD